MNKCFTIFSKILSFILIIFYILVLLYINYGNDEDYEYHLKVYKNCLENITIEETSSWRNEEETFSRLKEEKEHECREYNKIITYFVSCILIYIYIIFNIFIKISIVINGYNVSCQIYAHIALIFWYIGFITIQFFLSEKIFNRPKTHYTKFILIISNFFIDIILVIPFCSKWDDNIKYDCLDIYVEKNKTEKMQRINKKISEIERENNILKEENQKLIKFKRGIVPNTIEDKKIEVILWYVENKYNKKFFLNILYEYLLKEIKNKSNKIIDKNEFRKIILGYIKEKFEECLTCPITTQIFINPVIVPEGQTFDKYDLIKSLKVRGVNPITNKKLLETQLIDNNLIKDLCVIFTSNEGELNIENFREMKKLLINPGNNKFYTNPVVIKEGDKKGETKEGNGLISEYSNLAILNIIQENKTILKDEFFEDINENNIKNLINTEETLDTDTRLIINTNSKNI